MSRNEPTSLIRRASEFHCTKNILNLEIQEQEMATYIVNGSLCLLLQDEFMFLL